MNDSKGSRIPGFHKLDVAERQALIGRLAELQDEHRDLLRSESPLSLEAAARLTENTVGVYALPLGLALNFVVNGEDVLVPMVTEEPSVIAAASNAARLARPGGGFQAEADPPCMIAQVQLLDIPDPEAACRRIEDQSAHILARIDELAPGRERVVQPQEDAGSGVETAMAEDTPVGAEPERRTGHHDLHVHRVGRDARRSREVVVLAGVALGGHGP